MIDAREEIDRQPFGRAQYLAYGLLFLTLAIDGIDTQITSYLAPGIAREWQVSMGNLGLIFSVGLAGSALGALTLGALGDAVGLKRVILASTVLVGLATVAMSRARSIQDLAALRFLTGFGVGGTLPNLIALASQFAPGRRRATLITLTGCGFPAGATLAGFATAILLEHQGWRGVYLMAGVFPLLLTPLILFVLPESIPSLLRRKNGQPAVDRLLRHLYPAQNYGADATFSWAPATLVRTRAPLLAIFSDGRAAQTLLITAVFFLCLMNVYFLSNWLPSLLQKAHRSPHESILATTVFNLGGMIGALFLGRLIDWLGYMRVLGTALLGAAVCLIVLAITHFSFQGLLVAAFMGGFVVLGGQGGVNALPALIYPDNLRATASGWAVGTGRLGSVTGPLVAGWLLSAGWSYAQVLSTAALVPVLAAAVLLILHAAVKRHSRPYGISP